MKTKIIVFIVLLLLGRDIALGQGENNNWTFGYGSGFDFNGGGPSFFKSSIKTAEGCAAISNTAGRLLFYSDGLSVYDRTHTTMPNGSGILGDISSTQGVAIAPVAGVDSQYYVFTVQGAVSKGYLRYSIVDMRLNGTLGDIQPLFKNILIDSMLGEKMIIAGNCKYRWLLVHHADSAKFHAYNLSAGVGSPVISNVGPFGLSSYLIGEMKISPDGNKIALANYYKIVYSSVDLYDFDITTGVVSNHRLIDSPVLGFIYGVEFSPDGSKLYASSNGISQYNLSAGSLAAIRASKYQVDKNRPWGLRLGPDGMIYFEGTLNYSRIRNPDLAGAGCNFEANFGPAGISGAGGLTFGNSYPVGNNLLIRVNFRTLCSGSTVTIDRSRYSKNTWFDGSVVSSRSFSSVGTFWVKSQDECITVIDTFVITEKPSASESSLKRDTVCFGTALLLEGRTGADSFRWNDGATSASKTIHGEPGIYRVISKTGCTVATDTFIINEKINRLFTSSHKFTLCGNDSLNLPGIDGMDNYAWSNGVTGKEVRMGGNLKIWVSSRQSCNLYVDTFLLRSVPFTSDRIKRDTCICREDSVIIKGPALYSHYEWNGGSTKMDTVLYADAKVTVTATDSLTCRLRTVDYNVRFINPVINLRDTFTCSEKDTIVLDATVADVSATYEWDRGEITPKLKVNKAGTKFVIIRICGCSIIDTVQVKSMDLNLYIGADQTICTGDKITLKANLSDVDYQWSTGATTQEIEIAESGFYRLTVVKGQCSSADEANIHFVQCSNCVAMPNAFTPNNDGINDRFKPIFNCPVREYECSVLNRWGQILFTTTSPNEGWDGTSNGATLEGNVYYYMMKVKFEAQDDKEQMFKGDVTLIR